MWDKSISGRSTDASTPTLGAQYPEVGTILGPKSILHTVQFLSFPRLRARCALFTSPNLLLSREDEGSVEFPTYHRSPLLNSSIAENLAVP
ncbi:uncharacterized protein ColSpa_02775 [Colletotrichum spaethianum]|uniref:Uncharacterized protein n=1 Tax=Colletotrichum spaethianum TaxID=700344 RepID=A0AA37L8G1_9PEZI|nr:uncharacterized protein ColSpa_02775 [Colletotrichum spaethianum]GKT42594.1 hypothetical protein ColSpa_02775 [Colletotrichum spaethianum]